MTMSQSVTADCADPRLARVRARDRSADGTFVYAVKTTGVFCRPSCAARPARAENIAFYATGTDAEAAGFRACLRCHPLAAEGCDPQTLAMQQLAAYIRAHADETLPLARLADVAGLSPYHLQRSFKAIIGVSPKDFQAAARLTRFKTQLRAGDSVLGATFEAGYGSTSRVYEQVNGQLGMTPAAYRAGGVGEELVYAIRDSALGRLLMATTTRGVCAVLIGDDDASLIGQLAAEFPRAVLRVAGAASDSPLNDWMTALDAHLSKGATRPDLPLDLRGTAFQIKVWRFLMGVKPGDVVSYGEVARGIGADKAVRAVGTACGSNRLALLIPCHRALRADGSMGGYRWGLERKRALLDAERATRDGLTA